MYQKNIMQREIQKKPRVWFHRNLNKKTACHKQHFWAFFPNFLALSHSQHQKNTLLQISLILFLAAGGRFTSQ